jgi:hypothetical protein
MPFLASICLNAVYECLLQNAPANGFEDETEQVSFEVFTLSQCLRLPKTDSRQKFGRFSIQFPSEIDD